MKTKMVEIRDDGTRIMALAIKTDGDTPQEAVFWRACGFDTNSVVLLRPDDPLVEYDPYNWQTPGDTMEIAHRYIQQRFNDLPENGAVIDVRVVQGLRDIPATSEVWR